MCDEGRFGWKYVHDPDRLAGPKVRRGAAVESVKWEDLPEILTFRFEQHVAKQGSAGVVGVLSPMMNCEEAWLLAGFLQKVAPEVTLVLGHVPVTGEDQTFPVGAKGGQVKFTIRNEKCPNRRGIERIIQASGCPTLSFDEFIEKAGAGDVSAAWVAGGYPDKQWMPKDVAKASAKIELIVVQDIYENPLVPTAAFVLPSCAFVERDGSFINAQGKVQPFHRAIRPPDGCRRDGQYLYELAGHEGLYNAPRVRELMAATMPEFGDVAEAPPVPVHQH
jgi:NADH-quinone oxidoreductase subunit G